MAAMPMFFEIFFRESLNDFIPGAGLGVASFDDYDPDLKLLLFIVGDIMRRTVSSTSEISSEPESSLKTEENQNRLTSIMQRYATTITSTSRELTCKLGEKEYDKTSRIMKALSTYSWKTMATLALAAFAIKFGKLRMLTLLYATNPLARTVVLLKQQPGVPEHTHHLKSWFDTLASLINKTLELAEQILQYKERVQQQISPEKGDVKKTDYTIPTAAYWTVNSVVVCSSQIMDVLVMRKCTYTDLAAFKVNLDNLTEKLKSMVERLSSPPQESAEKVALYPVQTEEALRLKCLRNLCLITAPEVESERHSMPYKSISLEPESHVLSSSHKDEKCYTDIYEELVGLLAQKNLPLLDGSTKNRVSIDVLKSKMLLLFISDLDLLPEELLILKKVFMDSRRHSLENRFEIIWIPVLDNSISWKHKMHQFETIQSWMPWYSVYHPLLINPALIKYIKEMWQFNGKPLIVVLDSDGNVVNHNAIHMIRIWGSQAIPFTKVREEMLWKIVNWRVEFLVDSIDPLISGWIEEGKYLCLYGGGDKEWIQRFTNAAQRIANVANIQLAMVYMGNSCANDIVESNINTILSQNSSHIVLNLSLMKFFWLRLESMVRSTEYLTDSVEMDTVLKEIKTLLDYDKNGKSWAMIGQKDSMIMDKANGKEFLNGFLEYDQWKESAEKVGFLPALTSYIHELETKPNKTQLLKTNSFSRRHSRSNTRVLLKSLFCFADTPTD